MALPLVADWVVGRVMWLLELSVLNSPVCFKQSLAQWLMTDDVRL